MSEENILISLGSYIINPLPDEKKNNSEYYFVYDALANYSENRFVTIQEAMNLASLNALNIFKKLYDDRKFLLSSGDNGLGTEYVEYINDIEKAIDNLTELENNLVNVLKSEDAEEMITEYLFLDFEDEIRD